MRELARMFNTSDGITATAARGRYWLIALLAVLVSSAWAEPELKGQLDAFIVTNNDDGKEIFTIADSALPGQVIEYRLVYSNQGDEAIRGLKVLGPIPEGVEYVANSSTSAPLAELEATIDNGASWSKEPLFREVEDDNGNLVKEQVPPSQYQQIRWSSNSELNPDSLFNYSYRVKVLDKNDS